MRPLIIVPSPRFHCHPMMVPSGSKLVLVKLMVMPVVGVAGAKMKLATGGTSNSGRMRVRMAECERLPLIPVTFTV